MLERAKSDLDGKVRAWAAVGLALLNENGVERADAIAELLNKFNLPPLPIRQRAPKSINARRRWRAIAWRRARGQVHETMNDSPVGISCSGGGALGAYQAGVLKYIYGAFSGAGCAPFRFFSGVSVGAMNTTFLATYSHRGAAAAEQLEQIWLGCHFPSYHSVRLGQQMTTAMLIAVSRALGRDRNWSLLDPGPLVQTVHTHLDRGQLCHSLKLGTTQGIAIAATELLSGLPVWFTEGPRAKAWQRFHSVSQVAEIGPEHVIASCSVPLLFPPQRVGEHCYLDGGANLFRPLSALISFGCTRIVAIGTDVTQTPVLPRYREGFRPNAVSTIMRCVTRSLTHDHTWEEVQQLNVLNRVYDQLETQLRSGRTEHSAPNAIFDARFNPANYRRISVLPIFPSQPAEQLFREFKAEQRPGECSPDITSCFTEISSKS